jgi:serine/threonine-protein kinase ULK2
MPSPAAPPSKRIHSVASNKSSSKKDGVDDDDAKPYVIVNDIGKGSFATVYKGYHEVRVVILIISVKSDSVHGIRIRNKPLL